jgi:hypothetical protein
MTRPLRAALSGALIAAGVGVSAVAVVGMALTASATPMVGIVLQSGGSQEAQQPAASSGGLDASAPDTYEEALDRTVDPRTGDARAVIDTDRERAVFAALQNDCMADAGFDWWDAGRGSDPWWAAGKSIEEQAAVYTALHGSQLQERGGGSEYRWELAGCYGFALHETGNDDNH